MGFGPKKRNIGESAKSTEVSNWRNTVACLPRLIGHKWGDTAVQWELPFLTCETVDDGNGELAVRVQYKGGETRTFTVVEVLAMFLTELKQTVARETEVAPTDVVLSVPPYYTDEQRRAVLAAAQIADLNCLRLMNSTTAAALTYGMPKTDLHETEPRNVVFVDIGQSHTVVCVAAFLKGKVSITNVAFDANLGGRDIDLLLAEHISAAFQSKHKLDVHSNARARLRIMGAAERLKKVLSANSNGQANIESLMNDLDIKVNVARADLEGMMAAWLQRLEAPLLQALGESGLQSKDMHSVELIGGTTRIPIVKEKIASIFEGIDIRSTLNQDESIAKGCTFQVWSSISSIAEP